MPQYGTLGVNQQHAQYNSRNICKTVCAPCAAGVMKLKNNKFAKDMRPLDEKCSCMVCKKYTRSYLHHTIKAQGMAAPAILITYHNVAYMQVDSCVQGWLGQWWSECLLKLRLITQCNLQTCTRSTVGGPLRQLVVAAVCLCACVHVAAWHSTNMITHPTCAHTEHELLISVCNCICFQGLTWRLRAAIKEQRLPQFVRSYVAGMFPAGDVPQWVVDALDFSGISLEGVAKLKPAHDFYDKVPHIARVPAV